MPKTKPRTTTPADKILGRTIRALRLRAGLSQKDIAWQLGISYQQVQKYENGNSRISVSYLAQLRRIYGVSYEILLEGLDPNSRVRPPLPDDRLSTDIFRKIAAINDDRLKQKINRIIDIISA